MKKKTSENRVDDLEKDFQTLQKKIASDERKCVKLLKQIEAAPTEKDQLQLARLEASIAENKRKLSSITLAQILAAFDEFGRQMLVMIEAYDDRLLLTMGEDAPQIQTLQFLQQQRNEILDSSRENAREMVGGLDSVIEKVKEKIEEKRQLAATHFPELARSLKPREYEMPADYIEYVNFLMNQIELRDKYTADLKFATPEKRREAQRILSEMGKLIDEGEKKLAFRYELHQKNQRHIEDLRSNLKFAGKTELKELREHLKKNPTRDGVLERLLKEEFPE